MLALRDDPRYSRLAGPLAAFRRGVLSEVLPFHFSFILRARGRHPFSSPPLLGAMLDRIRHENRRHRIVPPIQALPGPRTSAHPRAPTTSPSQASASDSARLDPRVHTALPQRDCRCRLPILLRARGRIRRGQRSNARCKSRYRRRKRFASMTGFLLVLLSSSPPAKAPSRSPR
jgi:hypothetical protein